MEVALETLLHEISSITRESCLSPSEKQDEIENKSNTQSLNFGVKSKAIQIRSLCYEFPALISTSGIRNTVWEALLIGRVDESVYSQVYITVPSDPCIEQHVLEADIGRTRTDVEEFLSNHWRKAVQISLQSFCLSMSISYKQGMNEVLAPFMYLNPPTSDGNISQLCFDLFKTFITRYLYRYFCKDDSSYLFKAFRLFHLLLLYFDPILALHLDNQDVPPELYSSQWLLTIFARSFPLMHVYRIWDSMLTVDDPCFTFFLAVSVIRKKREKLLCGDTGKILEIVFSIRLENDDEVDEIISDAINLYKQQLPESFLSKLRLCCSNSSNLKPINDNNKEINPINNTNNSRDDMNIINDDEKNMSIQAARSCLVLSAEELVQSMLSNLGIRKNGLAIPNISNSINSSNNSANIITINEYFTLSKNRSRSTSSHISNAMNSNSSPSSPSKPLSPSKLNIQSPLKLIAINNNSNIMNNNNNTNNGVTNEVINTNNQSNSSNNSNGEYLIIDLRPRQESISNGSGLISRRVIQMDPEILGNAEEFESWLGLIELAKGTNICIVDLPPPTQPVTGNGQWWKSVTSGILFPNGNSYNNEDEINDPSDQNKNKLISMISSSISNTIFRRNTPNGNTEDNNYAISYATPVKQTIERSDSSHFVGTNNNQNDNIPNLPQNVTPPNSGTFIRPMQRVSSTSLPIPPGGNNQSYVSSQSNSNVPNSNLSTLHKVISPVRDEQSQYAKEELYAATMDETRQSFLLASTLQRLGYSRVSVLDGGFPALVDELLSRQNMVEPLIEYHDHDKYNHFIRTSGRGNLTLTSNNLLTNHNSSKYGLGLFNSNTNPNVNPKANKSNDDMLINQTIIPHVSDSHAVIQEDEISGYIQKKNTIGLYRSRYFSISGRYLKYWPDRAAFDRYEDSSNEYDLSDMKELVKHGNNRQFCLYFSNEKYKKLELKVLTDNEYELWTSILPMKQKLFSREELLSDVSSNRVSFITKSFQSFILLDEIVQKEMVEERLDEIYLLKAIENNQINNNNNNQNSPLNMIGSTEASFGGSGSLSLPSYRNSGSVTNSSFSIYSSSQASHARSYISYGSSIKADISMLSSPELLLTSIRVTIEELINACDECGLEINSTQNPKVQAHCRDYIIRRVGIVKNRISNEIAIIPGIVEKKFDTLGIKSICSAIELSFIIEKLNKYPFLPSNTIPVLNKILFTTGQLMVALSKLAVNSIEDFFRLIVSNSISHWQDHNIYRMVIKTVISEQLESFCHQLLSLEFTKNDEEDSLVAHIIACDHIIQKFTNSFLRITTSNYDNNMNDDISISQHSNSMIQHNGKNILHHNIELLSTNESIAEVAKEYAEDQLFNSESLEELPFPANHTELLASACFQSSKLAIIQVIFNFRDIFSENQEMILHEESKWIANGTNSITVCQAWLGEMNERMKSLMKKLSYDTNNNNNNNNNNNSLYAILPQLIPIIYQETGHLVIRSYINKLINNYTFRLNNNNRKYKLSQKSLHQIEFDLKSIMRWLSEFDDEITTHKSPRSDSHVAVSAPLSPGKPLNKKKHLELFEEESKLLLFLIQLLKCIGNNYIIQLFVDNSILFNMLEYGPHLYDLLRFILKIRTDITDHDRYYILSVCSEYLIEYTKRNIYNHHSSIIVNLGVIRDDHILLSLCPNAMEKHCTGKKWSFETIQNVNDRKLDESMYINMDSNSDDSVDSSSENDE
eukprot:gene5709-7880_t